MKNLSYICMCAVLSFAAACGSAGHKTAAGGADTAVKAGAERAMPGSDRDDHGCIGSAGYRWSEVRQDCIRIFEDGVQLVSATDPQATLAAYVVFGTDSLQAELFLPDDQAWVLDRRTLPDGGYAWNAEDDDTPNVRRVDGRWVVERRGRVVYRQSEK